MPSILLLAATDRLESRSNPSVVKSQLDQAQVVAQRIMTQNVGEITLCLPTKTDFNQLDGNRHPTLASVSCTDATVQGFFAKAKSLFGNRKKDSAQGIPADFFDQVYRALKRSFTELLVANTEQSFYAFACRSYRRGNDREMGR